MDAQLEPLLERQRLHGSGGLFEDRADPEELRLQHDPPAREPRCGGLEAESSEARVFHIRSLAAARKGSTPSATDRASRTEGSDDRFGTLRTGAAMIAGGADDMLR